MQPEGNREECGLPPAHAPFGAGGPNAPQRLTETQRTVAEATALVDRSVEALAVAPSGARFVHGALAVCSVLPTALILFIPLMGMMRGTHRAIQARAGIWYLLDGWAYLCIAAAGWAAATTAGSLVGAALRVAPPNGRADRQLGWPVILGFRGTFLVAVAFLFVFEARVLVAILRAMNAAIRFQAHAYPARLLPGRLMSFGISAPGQQSSGQLPAIGGIGIKGGAIAALVIVCVVCFTVAAMMAYVG